MDGLEERCGRVRERIAAACARSGRPAGSVLLVAATKGVSADSVSQAMGLGVTDFGENRVQEASEKIPRVIPRPRWHLVGHLQTNKAKRAVELFDVVQSVDSSRVAEELSRRAVAAGRCPDVLLEVNTSGEAGKFGAAPGGVIEILAGTRRLGALNLRGLMTIGPLRGGPGGARAAFRELASLRAEAVRSGYLPEGAELSMGMSGDYEVAIEEGATIVRIGTAIFGPRPAPAGPGG